MSKEPILETERLILRPLTLEDAEACYRWTGDERVTEFMSYSAAADLNETVEWIESTLTDPVNWNWAFVLKEGQEVIGSGGIGPDIAEKDAWSFGYNLRYDSWHKGYCTEAMKAILAFAREQLGVRTVVAHHAAENPRSGRVIENCGLKFDHFGEYSKNDGSRKFPALFYRAEWE